MIHKSFLFLELNTETNWSFNFYSLCINTIFLVRLLYSVICSGWHNAYSTCLKNQNRIFSFTWGTAWWQRSLDCHFQSVTLVYTKIHFRNNPFPIVYAIIRFRRISICRRSIVHYITTCFIDIWFITYPAYLLIDNTNQNITIHL